MKINLSSTTFSQSPQNHPQKNVSDKNVLIYLGIIGGTTSVGTSIGYYLYNKDKLEIKSKIKASSDTVKNLIPKGFLEAKKQLDISFYDLAERHKTKKDTVFPNCIMLVGESQILNKHLAQDLGAKSNCNFVELIQDVDITHHLEQAEKQYQKTSKRTLMYIDKFDELINPTLNQEHQIAGLKDLMSCASDEYHTTIIFGTKDPTKLDPITIQSHRIGKKIHIDVEPDDYGKYLEALKKDSAISKKYWLKPEKTKIWKGALIGLLFGVISASVKYFNSNKQKNKGERNG